MLKYSIILIGIYVLYYGGNIVYDLFLKKEKTAVTARLASGRHSKTIAKSMTERFSHLSRPRRSHGASGAARCRRQ